MCCPVIYPCGRWWTVHQRRSLLRAGWSVFMMRTVWNRLSGVNKHFVLFYCWGMNCQKSHVALLKVPSPLDRWVTRPSNALYVCGVVAPSHFSPRSLHFCYSSLYPLGVCVWGAGRFVFIVIKPLTPIICSSIHPCYCFLIERLYIYYSFDWLPLITSQVQEINHFGNSMICILSWEVRLGNAALVIFFCCCSCESLH